MNSTDNKNSTRKKPSERLVPYIFFWTDEYGDKMKIKDWAWSRKFTLTYLAAIWGIVAVLDFASTRNCEGSWQLAFACDQAIWMIKIYTKPFEFFTSVFTSPFFHNGLDHILFVTIFGMMLPVQSFEMQHGSKLTAFIFFGTYFLGGFFSGFVFNLGIDIWPESEFYIFGFERNWMGGSVGFFGVIGALSYCSRKKWAMLLMVVAFEGFNYFILDITPQISFIHMTSATFGFMLVWLVYSIWKPKFLIEKELARVCP